MPNFPGPSKIRKLKKTWFLPCVYSFILWKTFIYKHLDINSSGVCTILNIISFKKITQRGAPVGDPLFVLYKYQTLAVVWALWPFRIFIWSEQRWWTLKEWNSRYPQNDRILRSPNLLSLGLIKFTDHRPTYSNITNPKHTIVFQRLDN